MDTLQKLKNEKSSKNCDQNGVDRILCYEIYYYTFNFKPEIFLEEEEIDKKSLDNNQGLYTNENCEICSNLNRCSYSDCQNEEQSFIKNSIREVDSDVNKLKNNTDIPINFLEKSYTKNELNNLNFMIENLNKELNTTSKVNGKNNVHRGMLQNYISIVKIKLDNIINNLDFLKTINDNSKDLINSLSKYKKMNFTSVLENKEKEATSLRNYFDVKQKVKDIQKTLIIEMRKKDHCDFFTKLSLLAKEIEDVASDFHDKSKHVLSSTKTVISKNLS
jgi:hypothetical protein